MMRRTIRARVIDRLWTSMCVRRQGGGVEAAGSLPASCDGSVSGTMGWPAACQALASGEIAAGGFRRMKAVREVVETLAPSDGRHFAEWIRRHDGCWLDDERVVGADDWGDPIKAWHWILGTRRAFSPTTLRYFAHAIWLRDCGYVRPGGVVVERTGGARRGGWRI